MRKAHRMVLLLLVIALVGCDHATKKLAQRELRGQDDITLISGLLDLTYTENWASSFSMFSNLSPEVRRPFLTALGILAIPLYVGLWIHRRRGPFFEHLGFGLLIAGAIGNVGDRVARGYVIDFIHLHYWPVFNVADMCLTFGAIMIALVLLWARHRQHTLG